MLNMEAALGAPGRRWLRWLVILVTLVVVAAAALWVAQPLGARTASLVTGKATTGTIVAWLDVSGAIASRQVEELNFGAGGTVGT